MAKKDYERINNHIGSLCANALREAGEPEHSIRAIAILGNAQADRLLNQQIISYRHESSKHTSELTNWWMNTRGVTGKLKKTGVVGVAGLAAGASMGLLLSPLLGIVAGGVAGGSIATHVNRRRANAVITTKGNRNTLSFAQGAEDFQAVREEYTNNTPENGFPSVYTSTSSVEKRTDNEMLDNRRRVRQAVAVGKLAAGGGAFLARNLYDQFTGDQIGNPDTPSINSDDSTPSPDDITPRSDVEPEPPIEPLDNTPSKTEPGPIAPKDPSSEVLELGSFNVENGNGITQEIVDLAKANGIDNISPQRALEIYEKGVNQVGADNLISTRTYDLPSGRVGISAPGNSSWSPDFAKILIDELGLEANL